MSRQGFWRDRYWSIRSTPKRHYSMTLCWWRWDVGLHFPHHGYGAISLGPLNIHYHTVLEF